MRFRTLKISCYSFGSLQNGISLSLHRCMMTLPPKLSSGNSSRLLKISCPLHALSTAHCLTNGPPENIHVGPYSLPPKPGIFGSPYAPLMPAGSLPPSLPPSLPRILIRQMKFTGNYFRETTSEPDLGRRSSLGASHPMMDS